MLDVGLSFLWPDGHSSTMLMEDDATHLPPIANTYEPSPTTDGAVTIAAVTDQQRTNLLIAMGQEAMLTDPRFSTPEAFIANLDVFREGANKVGVQMTTEEVLDRLVEADVPCGPIVRPEDVPDFPQVAASGALIESEHPVMGRIREPRPPARFEATPSELRQPAPSLGEHTDAVLAKLGRDAEAIAKLRADGVIG